MYFVDIIEIDPPYAPDLGNTDHREIFSADQWLAIMQNIKNINQKKFGFIIMSFVDPNNSSQPFSDSVK